MQLSSRHTRLLIILLFMGAAWGLTIPLVKISVSTGYQPLGVLFWQTLFSAIALLIWLVLRRKRFDIRKGPLLMGLAIALSGTFIPGMASYRGAAELPAGVMALIIAFVPMSTFVIALAVRNERFEPLKLMGVILGLVAVWMIVGPEASLPDPSKAIFVILPIIATLCYAVEDNMVAKFGLFGLQAVEMLFIATCFAFAFSAGSLLFVDQMIPLWAAPWGGAEYAILIGAVLHVVAYGGYIWMIGAAGPIFAAQVAYLVTGFGVLWSMLILGERYSLWIWGALGVMMIALFLVRPKQEEPLSEAVSDLH